MNVAYFCLEKSRGKSQPIEYIGLGYKKNSSNNVNVIYTHPRIHPEICRKLVEETDVFVSYRGEFLIESSIIAKSMEKKALFVSLMNVIDYKLAVEDRFILDTQMDDSCLVYAIISEYGQLYFNKYFSKSMNRSSVWGIGVDLDLFMVTNTEIHKPPVFGFVSNDTVMNRRGMNLVDKIPEIKVISAIGSAINTPSYRYDEMYKFYNSIDCLLNLPEEKSLGYDSGNMSVLESGACGRPVISFPIGFAYSALSESRGMLVNNIDEACELVSRFKDSSELLDIGKRYREYIEKKCSWDVVANVWDDKINSYMNLI